MNATRTAGAKQTRVDWRAEALVLALATAEAAVVWLIVDLVLAATSGDEVRVPVAAVFVLVYLGTGLPRWLEALDIWDRGYGIAIAIAVAVSTLFAIKTASFPRFGWTDPGWLREAAQTALRVGTVAALIAAAAQASVRTGGATGATSGAVVAFFAAALAGIAMARLRANGGGAAGSEPRWLGAMLAPV